MAAHNKLSVGDGSSASTLRRALFASAFCFGGALESLAQPAVPPTGQQICYDAYSQVSCQDPYYPRQDADGGGALSYVKVDDAGQMLPDSALAWRCVLDQATGLLWESKTSGADVHGSAHRYSWASTDASSNGGEAGGGLETSWCADSLGGKACTTSELVNVANQTAWCGRTDWRVPTQPELLTLVHAGAVKPSISTAYFPNTASDVYWSATTFAQTPGMAWGVNFAYGASNAAYKENPLAVRLVSGDSR